MIEGLASADSRVLQVKAPELGRKITAHFDVRGVAELPSALRRACEF